MNKEKVILYLKNILKFSTNDLDKLQTFHDELLKFNRRYNLISKSTENDIWHRHILDSAQLVKYIDFAENISIADIGTGAGFPGVILAIYNKNPAFHVKLYEKSNVKCDFLEHIRSKIDVSYTIFGNYKNEEIKSFYVISRAFKKLEEVIRISREIIKVNHKLIILKGRNAVNEINRLKPYQDFIYTIESSITDPESKILFIEIKKK
jgi:16S rRNA (guanine527-N7)-methyltransferase